MNGIKKNSHSKIPRYQQIAVEIATRIASREYKVGDKIYARSSLASQHGVSSETARRAICVLCDLGIVSSVKGSGVVIKSYSNAEKFIAQQSKRKSVNEIKSNIIECIENQRKEMDKLNSYLNDMVTSTEHFRYLNPFVPFQIEITKDCAYINKSISEINFWQNTGATIIAVHREDNTTLSPGPYWPLLEHDLIFFMTQDTTPKVVEDFLYKKEP